MPGKYNYNKCKELHHCNLARIFEGVAMCAVVEKPFHLISTCPVKARKQKNIGRMNY